MAKQQGPGGLLAAIKAQATATIPGPKCFIARALADMTPADAADLRAALDDTSISSAAIAKVLSDRGWKMSHAPVQRHRRRGNGGCSCVDH